MMYISFSEKENHISIYGGDAGVIAGYQWIFDNGALLDVYGGNTWGFINADVDLPEGYSLIGGFNYGLNIGFAF